MKEAVLIREVFRNLRTRPVQNLMLVVLAFSCSVVAFAASTAQITGIYGEFQDSLRSGSNVWRVQSAHLFPATRCTHLQDVAGIRGVGILHSNYTALVEELPGARVNVIQANPDYLQIIWGLEAPQGGAGIGADLHATLGLRVGSQLTLQRPSLNHSSSTKVTITTTYPETRRLKGANQVIAIPVPPPRMVRECLIEVSPGALAAVEALLISAVDTGVSITRLHTWNEDFATPSVQMKSRVTIWIALAFPAVLLTLSSVLMFTRRSEWALYRLLGLRSSQQIRMLCYESIAVLWAPYSAGVFVVLVCSEAQILASLADTSLLIFAGDYLRASCLLIAAPAVFQALLSRGKSVNWVKGE